MEDWFQVRNLNQVVSRDSWDQRESRVLRNTEFLLELFERTESKATFFVLGWIARKQPDLIKRIAKKGHEIASHGPDHRCLKSTTRQQFAIDIKSEKAFLEELTGCAVAGYRAPNFSVISDTLWALDILHEAGFSYDSSIMSVKRRAYGIADYPRTPYRIRLANSREMLELSPSVVSLFQLNIPVGGGGYFRFWPYCLTRWAARKTENKGQPFCFYLHPWEIDPDQPRLSGLPPFSSFKHYFNLRRTAARLEKLLNDFRFTTYKQVAQDLQVKSNSLPAVQMA